MQERHPNGLHVIYAPACVVIAVDTLDTVSFFYCDLYNVYLVKVSYGFRLQLMSGLTSNLNKKLKAYKNI